jgi:aspartate/methionine/tyrosine aminotransferase
LVDLTVSNPTVCGFRFDEQRTLVALGNAEAMTYNPDPRGIPSARAVVARYYAERGATVDPEGVILTTSTSEAYSFLFRLLCDAGDEVLVARPSYPLFDFLADLEDVRLRTYPLFHDFGWWIDFAELERRIGPRTRAILLVHPNNPTGHATGRAERERLEELCVRHGLALVVDEVFLDYGLDYSLGESLGEPVETVARGPHPALTFVVSGLSKIAALPQMKVGWLACLGPEGWRAAALERLEVIADTFLSMNAPAQHALPEWLAGSGDVRRQIVTRVRTNLEAIPAAMDVLPVQAGWSAILRLPVPADESLAETLVKEAGVIVHPGSFYGLVGRGRIVVSLIGPAAGFGDGMARLMAWCESNELTVAGQT